jgi:hypothetical protein
MCGDRKYRAGLRKIMGSWESSTDRRRSHSTELSARIPPLSEIHLAYPTHNQPQLQEPIKIDFGRGHRPRSLMRQAKLPKPKLGSNLLHEFPWQGVAISARSLVSGVCLLLLDPPIDIDALKPPLASHFECG